MKSRNAIPPLICSLLMTTLAVVVGTVDRSDSTAAIITAFFALAAMIETAECIYHNVKIRKARKTALHHYIQSLKHKSA